MKCPKCGGTMVETTVRFCVCDSNPVIVVDGVPAYVCSQCGEKAYSDNVVEALESIRNGKITPRPMVVDSYNFSDIQQAIRTKVSRP